MKKLLLFFLMFFMSGTSYLLAQTAVTGTVTDENGDGIPGANIIIKGTRTGSVTDFDGNYSLNASAGDVLVYSYVGYSTHDVTVGSQAEVNVQLTLDIASLDEIVVTGYGTQRRKEVTSAWSIFIIELQYGIIICCCCRFDTILIFQNICQFANILYG